MVKVLVAYDTKYGNTKRVAELIAEGLKETEGVEPVIENIKTVDMDQIGDFDAVLVGSPNHIGRPTRTFKKFIKRLSKANLMGKSMAAFDTYVEEEFQKAMKKMEEHMQDKLVGIKLRTPGLSIQVAGMKGPVAESELPKCTEYGREFTKYL